MTRGIRRQGTRTFACCAGAMRFLAECESRSWVLCSVRAQTSAKYVGERQQLWRTNGLVQALGQQQQLRQRGVDLRPADAGRHALERRPLPDEPAQLKRGRWVCVPQSECNHAHQVQCTMSKQRPCTTTEQRNGIKRNNREAHFGVCCTMHLSWLSRSPTTSFLLMSSFSSSWCGRPSVSARTWQNRQTHRLDTGPTELTNTILETRATFQHILLQRC